MGAAINGLSPDTTGPSGWPLKSDHLIADVKLGLPADNRELYEQLARQKIVSGPLSRKLTRMAGFRNLLVHEYMEIDRRRVYAILTRELRDFDAFI